MTHKTEQNEKQQKKQERAELRAKAMKKNISNIVAVFGKKTIDLLQEYASIVKTHKTILDDSQFKELKLIEATDQQIEEYIKLRNHNKAHRRLESILSELKDLGFTIDFHKNQCAINKHDKTV